MTSGSTSAIPRSPDRDWAASAAQLAQQFAARATEHDEHDSFVAENYAALKAARMFSAGVPVELGGGGAGLRDLATILAALAKGCSSTALAFAMHTHPVALNVWRWHNDKAPVEPLLRRIATEELVLVSSGGSDWLDGAGRAERVDGGYRISGIKRFASGSPSGDLLMTSAVYDDPAEGPTVLHFGVPLKAPGVALVDSWRALGMRGTGSGDVNIDGFFLPEAAVGVRRPQGRWHRLFHIISLVAFPLIYAVYVSLAEVAHELALDRARRHAGDPHTVRRSGEMATELLAARLALEEMLRLGESAAPGPDSTSRLFAAKSLATRASLAVVEHAVTLVGGATFRRDCPLERVFRDIQGIRFHPLSPEAQLRLTGRQALGLAIDG